MALVLRNQSGGERQFRFTPDEGEMREGDQLERTRERTDIRTGRDDEVRMGGRGKGRTAKEGSRNWLDECQLHKWTDGRLTRPVKGDFGSKRTYVARPPTPPHRQRDSGSALQGNHLTIKPDAATLDRDRTGGQAPSATGQSTPPSGV
jgi:hypothetical protein